MHSGGSIKNFPVERQEGGGIIFKGIRKDILSRENELFFIFQGYGNGCYKEGREGKQERVGGFYERKRS